MHAHVWTAMKLHSTPQDALASVVVRSPPSRIGTNLLLAARLLFFVFLFPLIMFGPPGGVDVGAGLGAVSIMAAAALGVAFYYLVSDTPPDASHLELYVARRASRVQRELGTNRNPAAGAREDDVE